MAKKMTAREFKQALEKAGFNWEVWGYEGMLNLISQELKDMSSRDRYNGKFNLALSEAYQSKVLYDILDERGFYDIG